MYEVNLCCKKSEVYKVTNINRHVILLTGILAHVNVLIIIKAADEMIHEVPCNYVDLCHYKSIKKHAVYFMYTMYIPR